MELTGPPAPLIEGLDIVGFGAADVVLSPSGDLLFVRSSAGRGARLSWVRRDGSAELVDPAWGAESGNIGEWALSPDGRRLAMAFRGTSRVGSAGDIWIKDLDDGPLSRLTFEGINSAPAWTADGRAIIYRSARSTDPNIVYQLFRISADGSGTPEPLLSDPRGVDLVAVSRQGGWVVAGTSDVRAGGGDLLAFRPGQDNQMLPLLESPAYEGMPALSPDGRWLAYTSNETGQLEVHIRPFPEVTRGTWQVSVGGGSWPRWSHRGTELFYASSDGGFMTAEIRTSPTLSVGRPLRLHPSGTVPRFEVGLDDQRFLRLWSGTAPDSTSTELVLIQNFLSTLRGRR
jgi:serine/threonine-protein kinase